MSDYSNGDGFWEFVEMALRGAAGPATSLALKLASMGDDDFRRFIDDFGSARQQLRPVAFVAEGVGDLDGDALRCAEVLVVMRGRAFFERAVASGRVRLELGPQLEDAQEVLDAVEDVYQSRCGEPLEFGDTFPAGLIAAYPDNPYGMPIGDLLKAAEGACRKIERSEELRQALNGGGPVESVFLVVIFTPDESFRRMRKQNGELSAEFGFPVDSADGPETGVRIVAEAYDALAKRFKLPSIAIA
ncbi:hypothetical protein G8C93_06000 [Cellulosimicrobium cellulans]|uniref:hypothetical protein n=1 Tax=Cellulosimicrobium cellulans TaxID=1710 RepID=UPI0018847ACF|nr:hypothetical protein [Cellulosimicrobium cellulans]MBE9925443.1 hypothetical protein [Cellulosimicrobium cellulans]